MKQTKHLEELIAKMRRAGMPAVAIDNFKHHYARVASAQNSHVAEDDIVPVEVLPYASALQPSDRKAGQDALKKTALIKLNGGLGTSMGLNQAKSLIKIKDDLSFLDVIARQCIHADIPLVLMNSFVTHRDTIRALRRYESLQQGKNLFCFEQHKIPRISQNDLGIFSAMDSDAEWCPPGHGDLYAALVSSGTLDRLLDEGYETVFVSNSDNLGAVIDEKLLGYFVSNKLPFMMEVCQRTANDNKGGHLARNRAGQLMLREIAQCKDADRLYFEDIERHRFFNTNNIWINLKALKNKLAQHNNVLPLDLICNEKQFPDEDQQKTPVYQLETAMGAAISLFEGAQAICVDRSRFVPVKNTADLLRTRSNLYVLTPEYKLVSNPQVSGRMPKISLDERYFKTLDQYERRFSSGEPDLLECQSLVVNGDFVFGEGIRLSGSACMTNENRFPLFLTNNQSFTGSRIWS